MISSIERKSSGTSVLGDLGDPMPVNILLRAPLRRALAALLAVTITSSSLLVAGCGGAAPPDEETAATDTDAQRLVTLKQLDGQAVFRGIFLGEGHVATYFPEIWSGNGTLQIVPESSAGMDAETLARQVDKHASALCAEGCSEATLNGFRDAAARIRAGERDGVTVDAQLSLARATGPKADASITALLDSMEKSHPGFFDEYGAAMRSGNPVKIRKSLDDAFRMVAAGAERLDQMTAGDLNISGLNAPNLNPYVELDGPLLLVVVIAIAVVLVLRPADLGDSRIRNDMLVGKVASRLNTRR